MSWPKSFIAVVLIPLTIALGETAKTQHMTPTQALKSLQDGAERFASNKCVYPHQDAARLGEIVAGQSPYAMILSCADSRVPVEMIFDAGFGDLFVLRVAGNIASTDQIGSIEYGAEHLGSSLLVVMGHSKCGAVTAAAAGGEVEGAIAAIVHEIQPAVARAKEKKSGLSGTELVNASIDENIWLTIQNLLSSSPMLRERVEAGSLQIVGALYHLEDHKVEWMGRLPREKEFLASIESRPQSSEAPLQAQAPVALQSQLQELQAEIATLKEQSQPTDSLLNSLLADVKQLWLQVYMISGEPANSSRQLASIDEGFVLPDSSTIDKLSAQINTIKTDVEKTKKDKAPNAPLIKQGSINLTGMVHEQYYNRFGTTKSSSFDAKRVRLGVNGTINKYASIEIVGEFAKAPKLVDGDVSLYPVKNLTLRVGQFRPPSGTELSRSTAALPFVNYSMAMPLNTDRDLGFAAYYQIKPNPWLDMTLMGGLVNGSGANTSDSNTTKNQSFRAEIKLGEHFSLAPNAYNGKTNNVDGKNINTYGGTLNWHNKSQVLETEYTYSRVNGKPKAGWYLWGGQLVETGLKFCPEIQLVGRYEQFDSDRDISDNALNRVTLGANFFIDKKYTLLQLNYQINSEEGASISNDELLMNVQVAF